MLSRLPVYESLLLGRQGELESVLSLLRQGPQATRIVTLTGPGGVGKTRLAVQAALQWETLTGRAACFVPLATLADPSRVPIAIAMALDLQDTGSLPILASLKDYLRHKRELIVLDSFEHVQSATEAIAEFLEAAPEVQFLITSRAPLRVAGEEEIPVPPLVLPDLENLPSAYMLSNYAAISLFVRRAQAADPTFTLTQANAADVAEICVRLDGLPLAIELAAARIQSISPQAMRERLQSRLMLLIGNKQFPERHRSLRAAIDWSYELLTTSQRKLFMRLAVFAGSAEWVAMQAVCNERHDLAYMDEDLETLLDQSLVKRIDKDGATRYGLLETVQEYALEQLADHGETTGLHRCHALYFIALAEATELKLRGPEQQQLIRQLDDEFANLRAALSWTLDADEPELGLRLATALRWFWFVRGHVTEGREWLSDLLEKANKAEPKLRGRALNALTHLAAQSDINAAQRHAEEALALWQTLDDEHGLGDAYYGLGRVAGNRGDGSAQAVGYYERSLQCYLNQEYSTGVADAWFALGVMAANQGDYDRALIHYKQCLNLRREEGDTWGIARALSSLAFTAADQYKFEEAHRYGDESLRHYQQLNDRASAAALTLNLAYIEGLQGNYRESNRLAREALDIWNDTGRRLRAVSAYYQLSQNAIAESNYAEARLLGEQGLRLSEQIGFSRGQAWMLNGLGQVALYEGHLDEAERRVKECLALARRAEDKINLSWALSILGLVALEQGEIAKAQTTLQAGLHVLKGSKEMIVILNILESLASVLVVSEQAQPAVLLWGTATATRTELGVPMEPNRREAYAQALAKARTALGEGFATAWESGVNLGLEQTVALALEGYQPNPDSSPVSTIPNTLTDNSQLL
jgi:predicted ATPase